MRDVVELGEIHTLAASDGVAAQVGVAGVTRIVESTMPGTAGHMACYHVYQGDELGAVYPGHMVAAFYETERTQKAGQAAIDSIKTWENPREGLDDEA